jgi:hypothetical protein
MYSFCKGIDCSSCLMTTVRAGDQEQSGSLEDRNLRGEVILTLGMKRKE